MNGMFQPFHVPNWDTWTTEGFCPALAPMEAFLQGSSVRPIAKMGLDPRRVWSISLAAMRLIGYRKWPMLKSGTLAFKVTNLE